MNELCNRLVPRAVELLNRHMQNQGDLTYIFRDQIYEVTEDLEGHQRVYKVDTIDWKCDCRHHLENLLPCRHSLYVYGQEGHDFSELPYVYTNSLTRYVPCCFQMDPGIQ